MPHLIGPDFIGIQTEDIEAARAFYTEVLGLKVLPWSSWCGCVRHEAYPFCRSHAAC
jgi:predicted enzyme related to lactoylglutathione lyase